MLSRLRAFFEDYPLFGFWLPFIGFRKAPVDSNGDIVNHDEAWRAVGERAFLHFEWLNEGVALQVKF